MPEAVFSISAEIQPQLDQRALDQQAHLLAQQLNGVLAKNVRKVGIQGDTRSFNELKKQINDTSRFTQVLQRSMGNLRNTLGSVPAKAKEGFLKLSDAMGVTRRGIVGFGSTIRDTIRDTNRFEQALEKIHVSGGIFRELDQSFGSTIAQVRSGTSLIDQFAARGDHLAQMFLPMTKSSAAAQLNLEGLQQTLEGIANNFKAGFGAGAKQSFNAASVSTGSLNAEINSMQRTFLQLGKILPKGTAQQRAFFDTFEEAKAKGGMDDFVKGLVQQRDAANRINGPLGRVKVALGLVSKEGRDAAKVLRTETNQALVQLEAQFPGTVQGFDRLAARVRNAKDSLVAAGDTFKNFQAGLAAVIPGENIGIILSRAFDTTDALGGAGTFFDGLTNRFLRLRAQGYSVTAALQKAFKKTFSELDVVGGFVAKMDQARVMLGKVAVAAVFAAQFLKDDLTKGFNRVREAYQKVAAIPFGDLIGDTVNRISDGFIAARTAVNGFGQRALAVVQGLFRSLVNLKIGDRIGETVNKISDGFIALRNFSFGDFIGNSVNKISDSFIAARAAVANFAANAIPNTKRFFTNLKTESEGAEGIIKRLRSLFDHSLPFAERQSPKRRGPILHRTTPGDDAPPEPPAAKGFLADVRRRNQVRADKLAEEAKRKAKPAGAIDDSAVGTLPLAKFGDALKAEIDGLAGKLDPSLRATGRRIGETLMSGVMVGVHAGIKGVEAAIAKMTAGATAAVSKASETKAPVIDPSRPALRVEPTPAQPKTIQLPGVRSAKAQFEATGRANGEAFAQGTLDGANFETKLGGALEAQINKITGRLASPVDANGRRIGEGLSGGMLAGFGVNEKAVQGRVARIGSNAVSAIQAPFKIIKDVVSTTFRAFLGKGPAEGIGKIGKAASVALIPVRLLSQAIGKALHQGLQLATTALKVAGAAFAGFVGTAIATGSQFNSLQAIIRSTLPVILGSAEASETLLKQINLLNDESPFARSSFLELTRVLAGFGVEAEKITPLIDAIQQAVAATGGGEGDLLELGQAFARLQSQGRLSLDIIQSFSSRGIDVISILGQEFGKTQGEVRDMISDGLVPAGKAIDALTKGLKTKFDGATDAVSKNLPGALDRVKAKTRDFGAELTRAFINPTGGGAVVDLLNSFATIVSVITKQFLPLLRPALDAVAASITNMSKKAADFAKTLGSFEAGKLKEFGGGLDGLLGPLAALVALLPVVGQAIPFIGPIFASFVGAIPAATLAVTAFLLTLKPVRDGLLEFGRSLAPIGATLLPKVAAAFKALGNAVGPIVGKILAALGPVVRQVGATFGELFTQLTPIFQQFQRLFAAIEPVVDIVKNFLIAQWKAFQLALMAIGPVIEWIIGKIADFAENMKPGLQAIADWTDRLNAVADVQTTFERIIQPLVDAGNAFVTLKDQSKGFFDSLPGAGLAKNLMGDIFDLGSGDDILHLFDGGDSAAKKAADAVKKLTEDIKKQATEIDKTADAFHDGYTKAKKAAEDAEKNVGTLTDQLKQQMAAYQGMLDPLIEAQKAVEATHAAQKDASAKAKDAAENVTDIIKEQAKALRDVIAPTDELAVAQRNLVRTQNELRDLDREEVDLQKELADLRGETATDERAALDRALERAKIALNKAQKEQNELLNEGNKAEKANLDLTGLTVDQIKTRLSTVRASLKAQRDTKKPVSAQDKADERTSAALDVADATQAVKDAGKARAQFEVDNTRKIRDNEERIAAIGADKADKLLDEAGQLNHIADLRAGETAQLGVIKDFEEKIKNAKDANVAAQKAVTDAVMATRLAELALQLKTAEINKDYDKMFAIQGQINGLKSTGLSLDTQTEASLKAQATLVAQTLKDRQEAIRLQKIMNDEERIAAIKDLGQRSSQRDFLWRTVQESLDKKIPLSDETLKGITDSQKAMADALIAVNANAGILNKQGQPVVLTTAQLENILLSVSEDMVTHPKMSILEILRAILDHMGLHIPTAASGYAPGVHRGLNDGRGLMRMFEYGQEAVLPLTRKLDMYRIVNSPSVLPKILEALPKVSLAMGTADLTGSLLPMKGGLAPPPGVGDVGLDSISRTSGRSQAVSTDSVRRKEQREFAGSVGEAVKAAVKEALSESGGSLGSDIDINVGSSSDSAVTIAREVRRQVERALGKW